MVPNPTQSYAANKEISVHCRQKGLEQPKYMMETVDKQFRASVKVKKEFFWNKRNFKFAKSNAGGGRFIWKHGA